MINQFLSYLFKKLAFKKGKCVKLYLRFCRPTGNEYAEYLRIHGGFFSIGNDCCILPDTNVTDPSYVKIGNNVVLSSCALIGHDGAIAVLNKAYNVKLDKVGKIEIKDNVFVGYGAIVLPGVIIGPNAIVGAGSVVTKDVPENSIVAGVPARQIGEVSMLVKKLQRETDELPWVEIIKQRDGAFDPLLEPELVRRRVKYFYGQ